MLGLARHAQIAGWGQVPFVVDFDNTAAFVAAVYQQPAFSLEVFTDSEALAVNDGSVDLTNYIDSPGFGNKNYTAFATVYLPWGTPAVDDEPMVTIYNQVSDGTITGYLNSELKLSADTTTLNLNAAAGLTYALPGAASDYYNRWLTVFTCASDTYTNYTNWTGATTTGSQYSYHRQVLFDTQTLQVIAKFDQTIDYFSTADITTVGNSLPVIKEFGTSAQANFGMFTLATAGTYGSRMVNHWGSFGTMIDPLQMPNTSWATAHPSGSFGNAIAWINLNFTNYDDTYSSTNTSITHTGSDLYTPTTSNLMVTVTDSTWAAGYSSTIIPKDYS